MPYELDKKEWDIVQDQGLDERQLVMGGSEHRPGGGREGQAQKTRFRHTA